MDVIVSTAIPILNTCYNPKLLKKHGWCKLFQGDNSHTTIDPGIQPWGICSSSCNTTITKDPNYPGSRPDIYHELNWRIQEWPHQCEFRALIANIIWDPNYMLCVKSELPNTNVVKFKVGSQWPDRKWRPDWKDPPTFEQEQPPDEIISYQQFCHGDSGAGSVITNGIEENVNNFESLKYAIANIATWVGRPNIDGTLEKRISLPCGSNTYTKHEPVQRHVHTSAGTQSIVWPEVFNWIQQHLASP